MSNLFRKVGQRVGRFLAVVGGNISDLLNPKNWLLEWSMGGGRTTQAGEVISSERALAISAYYACLRCISEDVAKLPLIVYRRMARGKERYREHPLYVRLHDQPNDDMGSMEFRQLLQFWACGWGGGFAEIAWSGTGAKLHPIHPSRVTINPSINGGGRIYSVANERAAPTFLQAENVFHLHGLGNELGGYSVARIAAESLGLTLAAQTFGSSFFGNGSTVNGVLTHPNHLGEGAQENLRKSWADRYGGPYNASKPAILEEGMKWERIGIPPEEAQFLETRMFQVEEVCRWFRMPPHKIQHLLRATFSNIAHQAIEYVVDTLTPWLTRWEQEIQRKLFVGEPDLFAEHLTLGLLRGDEAARVAFYNGMFMIGSMSQNDIREAENMNGIGPEGDVYYIPLNMVRSEDAAEGLPQNMKTPTDNPSGVGDGNLDEMPPADVPGEDSEDDGNPLPEAPPPRPNRSEMVEALRPMVEQLLGGVLRKEEKAVVRAAEKYGSDIPEFTKWLDDFYLGHVDYFLSTMSPLYLSLTKILERPFWAIVLVAHESVLTNKRELQGMFAAGKVQSDFPAFAAGRIQILTETIMEEALDVAPVA